jgi:hypothetical protein
MAGVAGVSGAAEAPQSMDGAEVQVDGDSEETCDTCGSHDCACGDVHEALDENEPDWPTDTVNSDDALQYSGGLNKPKTDVAGDGQTTIPVTAVHTSAEDDLRRIREMAGIKEEKKSPKADKDYDKDGEVESEKDEVIGSRRKAAGLDEGILAATAQLWKTYRG